MRILALETSWRIGSVAALEDDRVLGHTAFDPGKRTAQSFAPAMLAQLESVRWKPNDVQLIAVAQGPGSFTGLRIGITAAKTFAYAVGAEVIGVHTLQAIASQTPTEHASVEVVADAQRGQLFAAAFRRDGRRWRSVGKTQILDRDRWLGSLTAEAVVTGPGLDGLRNRLPADAMVVGREHWDPQAQAVGRVGYLEYASGKRDDLWKLVPHYYRPSAAEEKLNAQRTDP